LKIKSIAALVAVCFTLAACGQSLTVEKKTYGTYGIFSNEDQNPSLKYKVIWGNVFGQSY
jgi:hypothetical protein